MKLNKLIATVSVVLLAGLAFSQWQQLPEIPQYGISTTRQKTVPVGNGKLFFGLYYFLSPSTIDYTAFGHSDNDLGAFAQDFIIGSNTNASYYVWNINYANDSTICYVVGGSVSFTFNNFKTMKTVSPFQNANNQFVEVRANCMTRKYIYYTQHVVPSYNNPTVTNDTLLFNRADITSVKKITKLPLYSDATPLYNPLVFVNDSVGFFLVNYVSNASKLALLKTIDYGQTWSEVMIEATTTVSAFCFPSAQTGYVVKAGGIIYKTTNGGANWSQITSPSSGLSCISFGNDTLGYVTAGKLLWKTTDGGASWQSETSNATTNIASVYTFDSLAYFVDGNNNVFKNQARLVGIKSITDDGQLSIFPNPAYDHLTIDLSALNEDVQSVQLTNLLGEMIYEEKPGYNESGGISIPVQGFSAGTYFMTLHTEKQLLRKKVVIAK